MSRHGFTRRSREIQLSASKTKQLNIKCRSVEDPCQNLSGGNRQKVVLAKLFATDAEIFLLDNPTRRIDIWARAEIYQLMNKLTACGAGTLFTTGALPRRLPNIDPDN